MDVFPVFVNQLVILGCQSNPQAQAYWQDASEIPRPPTVWDDVGKPYKQWDSCHINWWVYRISANHQTTPGLGHVGTPCFSWPFQALKSSKRPRPRRPNVPCNTCASNVTSCAANCKAETGFRKYRHPEGKKTGELGENGGLPSLKLTFSPLKNGGERKTILSYFSGASC